MEGTSGASSRCTSSFSTTVCQQHQHQQYTDTHHHLSRSLKRPLHHTAPSPFFRPFPPPLPHPFPFSVTQKDNEFKAKKIGVESGCDTKEKASRHALSEELTKISTVPLTTQHAPLRCPNHCLQRSHRLHGLQAHFLNYSRSCAVQEF